MDTLIGVFIFTYLLIVFVFLIGVFNDSVLWKETLVLPCWLRVWCWELSVSPWRNPFTPCRSLFMFKTMCSVCFQFYPDTPPWEPTLLGVGRGCEPHVGQGGDGQSWAKLGVKPRGFQFDLGSCVEDAAYIALSISSPPLSSSLWLLELAWVTVPEGRGGHLRPLSLISRGTEAGSASQSTC